MKNTSSLDICSVISDPQLIQGSCLQHPCDIKLEGAYPQGLFQVALCRSVFDEQVLRVVTGFSLLI